MSDVNRIVGVAAVWLLGVGAGCGGESAGLSEAASRGQRVYNNVCIACHNGNPNLDGALGPAIAGSSRELLLARVVEGRYPDGYTPKRSTEQMPSFEYLAADIDDLWAYLSESQAE
jgi:mono/diheme cytochrome c family protein